MAKHGTKLNAKLNQDHDEYTGTDYLVDAVIGIIICALMFLVLIYG